MHGIINIIQKIPENTVGAMHSDTDTIVKGNNNARNASPVQRQNHPIPDSLDAMHSDADNIARENNCAKNASPVQRPHGTISGSLGAIMQNFQSVTCRKINKINKTPGRKLWQRNYWERIIRNESELIRIRNYIRDNPFNWKNDDLNK